MPVRVNLRIPDDLYERIEQIRAAEDRTMTAQLIRMLRQALREYPPPKPERG